MQKIVSIGLGEKRKERIDWLNAHGYKGDISENYQLSAIVIEGKYFFQGNVTCFAAAASCGLKALSWEEWLKQENV